MHFNLFFRCVNSLLCLTNSRIDFISVWNSLTKRKASLNSLSANMSYTELLDLFSFIFLLKKQSWTFFFVKHDCQRVKTSVYHNESISLIQECKCQCLFKLPLYVNPSESRCLCVLFFMEQAGRCHFASCPLYRPCFMRMFVPSNPVLQLWTSRAVVTADYRLWSADATGPSVYFSGKQSSSLPPHTPSHHLASCLNCCLA